jgi:hypothetical protein
MYIYFFIFSIMAVTTLRPASIQSLITPSPAPVAAPKATSTPVATTPTSSTTNAQKLAAIAAKNQTDLATRNQEKISAARDLADQE